MPLLSDDFQLTAPAPNPVIGASAQVVGQRGLRTYYYWWVTHFPIGVSVSAPILVRNAPDILSASNSVTVTGPQVVGATGYDLLRTDTPQLPSVAASIGLAAGLGLPTFSDQGQALVGYSVAGLALGAPVSAHIVLNNRDYAKPVLTIWPFSLGVSSLTFADGTTQNTAGSGVSVFVDETSNRAVNTTYTNNHATPLFVTISVAANQTGQTANVLLDGVPIASVVADSPQATVVPVSFWVLPGHSYQLQASAGVTISHWVENW